MSGFPEDFEDEANPIEMREEEYIGVEEMEMDDFNQQCEDDDELTDEEEEAQYELERLLSGSPYDYSYLFDGDI